jgi:hypothetical protein
MADATVTLSADLSQLRRELAKIPNLSGDAAQSALVKLEKAVVSAEKAAKRSTTAIKRQAAQQAREYEQSLGKIRTGSEKVFGGIVGDVLDVGSALGALGPAAGVAAAGLLATGGIVFATGLAVAGVVSLVDSADDMLAKLDEVGAAAFITAEQRAQIEGANSALDAVRTTLTQLGVVLAADFAPSVESGAETLVGFSASIRDNYDAVKAFTVATAAGVSPKLAVTVDAAAGLLDKFTQGLQSAGAAEIKVQTAAAGAARVLQIQSDLLAELGKEDEEDRLKRIAAAAREETAARANSNREMARTLAEIQKIQDAAQSDVKIDPVSALMAEVDALDALGSAWQRSAAIQAAVAAAKSELLARGERESQAAFEAEQERINQLDTKRQATMAQLEQMATEGPALAAQVTQAGRDIVSGLVVAMADSFEKLAGGLAGGVSDLAGALAESGQLSKEAAMKAYRVSQAAALAQIGIMTAAGVARQFADLPFPAALITSIGIAATGAAQAIQVANTPPPQFFAGGMVTAAPDAIPAVLHSGEVVQTAASVRRETGGDVRSRNSGASQAPATYIQNIVDGRVVSQVIGNEAKRPGSTVRATVGTGIYGQRRRY